MATYRAFVEINDWEGETWKFYIPVEENEDALNALEKAFKADDECPYSISRKTYTTQEVKTLVKHAKSGYYPTDNLCEGKLVIGEIPTDSEAFITWSDKFYKGQIVDCVQKERPAKKAGRKTKSR